MKAGEVYKNQLYYATEFFVVTQVDGEHVEGLHISSDGTCPVRWLETQVKEKRLEYLVFDPSTRMQ